MKIQRKYSRTKKRIKQYIKKEMPQQKCIAKQNIKNANKYNEDVTMTMEVFTDDIYPR